MEGMFSWDTLKEIGAVGLCIVIVYFGFQSFRLILAQWQNSTDAVNKNTEAFQKLSGVFEKSYEREVEFQAEMRERVKDTQQKVSEIHKKVV